MWEIAIVVIKAETQRNKTMHFLITKFQWNFFETFRVNFVE